MTLSLPNVATRATAASACLHFFGRSYYGMQIARYVCLRMTDEDGTCTVPVRYLCTAGLKIIQLWLKRFHSWNSAKKIRPSRLDVDGNVERSEAQPINSSGVVMVSTAHITVRERYLSLSDCGSIEVQFENLDKSDTAIYLRTS
jgi:hypothetical protein